jgi:GcrA cell cycle regulator
MSGWNEAKVETLTQLWGEGISASEIARQIGGVTRNAVIGKAHRMKLGEKGKTHPSISKKEGAAIPKTAKAIVKLQARATVAPAMPEPVVIKFELPPALNFGTEAVFHLTERTCKWPVGDPTESSFRFCGAARGSDPRAPYCTHHVGMAYAEPSKRSVNRVRELRSA